jgi:hypothetical protein
MRSGPLAVEIEIQFQGYVGSDENSFGNVDRILRESGLTLIDLKPVRYSRAALPQPFAHDIPANTTQGAVFWADFLYMRDVIATSLGCPFTEQEIREAARKQCLIAYR